MKKLLLSGCLLAGLSTFAQTSLYLEDFESGGASFTLNSSDLGANTTFNTWLINNTYSGGSGTFVCMGFPFSFTVSNTPSQPGGITGAPSSNYLHIAAQAAISSGINCASYIPSDGGTCVSDETNFSKMTSPISTIGYTNVTFDFWWMCAGSADAYGEVYYSLDGGSSWVLKQSNLNNVTNWSQLSLTDPLWDNVASVMFAFRFVNSTAATAADPAFSIDEVEISGTAAASASISTDNSFAPGSWCYDDVITGNVGFVATGTFNAGNTFTAELSDASGSFAAPTTIGTLSSTSSGSLSIPVTIAAGTAAGNGYRIRVNSSSPSTTGTDNGTDLIIYDLPVVSLGSFTSVCDNSSAFALTGGLPAGGIYTGTGVAAGSFNPSNSGPGSHSITYTYVDVNGCENTSSQTITVHDLPVVSLGTYTSVCEYTPAFTLTGGLPAGGTYSGTGVTTGSFDPASAGLGTHTITYSYTDANSCENSATESILVDGCAGITEASDVEVRLFPNPTSTNFSISGINPELIELVDQRGRVVKTFTDEKESYSIEGLNTGVYTVLIYSNSTRISTKLIVR